MFTGIIKYNGIIKEVINSDKGVTISIFSDIEETVNIGDSICVNGICLTVVEITNEYTYSFNVMSETLLKTTLKEWKVNDEVNIELSAKSNIIQLDGHIVSGHVDCSGEVIDIRENIYFIRCPKELTPLITDKGSITVDGTSLTISTCYENVFTVSIIPLTLQWTIFRNYKVNTKVNLEGDCRLKTSNNFYGDIYTMMGKYILSDSHAMSIALKLSEKGLYSAPPNPHVGCIITKDKKIIGMGFHLSPGNPHAEIEAIRSCNEDITECEIFVTLEPCCHVGRTGKCVDAIIKHSFKRVVVGVCDTDKRVNQKGIKELIDAGIKVDILNDEMVKYSLKEYLYQRANKKPYVYLKMATTLDNKCCASDGTSKWITSEESRKDSHRELRAKVQCIITTAPTVLKDFPKLNVRLPESYKDPLVVVLDKYNEITPDIIKKCGWEHPIIWRDNIYNLLTYLYDKLNIISVLIETGPSFFNYVIDKGLWNELIIYMSPSVLGSKGLNSFIYEDKGINISDKKVVGKLKECKQIGDDIKITIVNSQ